MLNTPRNLLKSNASTLDELARIADPSIIALAGVVAQLSYVPGTTVTPAYWLAIIAVALASLFVFPAVGLYRPQRGASIVEDVRALVSGWVILLALGVFLAFVTKSSDVYSRVWVALWVASGFFLQTLVRVVLRLVLRSLRRRGLNLRHICIVGAGELGREVALRLRRAPWSGLHLHGFYDDTPGLAGTSIDGVPVIGSIGSLRGDLDRGELDQVWIALPLRAEERIRQLVTELRAHPVQVRYVPDIFGFQLLRHSFSEVAGMPVIGLTDTPMQGVQRLLKAVEDYVGGGIVLLRALAGAARGRGCHPAHFTGTGALSPAARDVERTAFQHAQVPIDARSMPRTTAARCGRSRAIRAPRASARCCDASASTSCRNCSTCFAARCRWSVRVRSAPNSSRASATKSRGTCKSTWSRRASPAGRR